MIPYSTFDDGIRAVIEREYFSSFTLLGRDRNRSQSKSSYPGEQSLSSNLFATEHSVKARCGTDSLEKSEAPAAAGLRQLVGALQVKYQLGVTLSAVYLRYTGVQVLFLAPSAGGYAWSVFACGSGIFVFSVFLSLLVTWLCRAFMNTVKNVHSPAGMGYSLYGTKYVHLKDCPKCKYGTMDKREPEKHPAFWECADCGHRIKIQGTP